MESILEMWETAPNGEQMQKALEAAKQEKEKSAQPKSAVIDPGNMYGISGTRSKQAIVPFQMLRSMAKIPAVAAILLTRKNQVARYARRPRFDGDIGFRVGLKDFRKKMTDSQQKRAFEIEEFFLKTGAVRNRKRKDDFDAFLRKIVDDTLTLDSMVWENVPNLTGGIAEVWAVDAATVELVTNAPTSDEYELPVYEPMTKRGGQVKDGDIAYVQRIAGQIVAEYTEEELAYAIRNPRTDITTVDFGMSELEVLIEIVTGILNGTRYNTTYFTHSHLPQGVLEMVGKYQQADLDNFKRHWKQLTSGASGKWAVPVMALQEGQGFKFTPFKNSNKDMEFSQFMEFLFNIACAVYQIDPNEVGFKGWTSNSGGMTQSDNTAEKIDKSLDKGFVPLMNFLSNKFNAEIVDQLDEEFSFYWVGVDEEDEDRKLERQEKQIQLGLRTVAELRKADDCEDLTNPATGEPYQWVNAPANATLIQVFMAETGLGQQPQGSEGDPNDPQAEADAEQAAADDAHAKGLESADDGHEKDMEKLDKEHEQTMEQKKADQAHQMKMEKFKADNAKAMAKDSDKSKAKASEGKGKDDKPDPDDQHEKELEKMKLEHKHDMELEKQKQKGKPPLKKSLDTSEGDELNISITWDNY